MLDRAVALNSLLERHKRVLSIGGWICFVIVCADYARFINLPAIMLVPFWVGVTANVLRWGLWEGFLKQRVGDTMLERTAARRDPNHDGLPPPAEG